VSGKRKRKKRRWLRALIYLVIVSLGASGIFIALVLAGLFGRLPDEGELRQIRNPIASEVYAADGVLMGTFNIQNRQHLDPDDITRGLRHALVATEDVRFYEHRGIDFRSLLRVLVKSILLRQEGAGGGSTLTQQLAKNLYARGDHGRLSMPVNKVREMAIAVRMEKVYAKDEILELYLSTVPFGENTFGIKAAARRYFNRDPRELPLEDAAVLVGMLKANRTYNPVDFPERSKDRRNVVLDQMARYGFLEDGAADSLKSLPLQADYHPLPHYAGIAPYFREHIRLRMDRWCGAHLREGKEHYNLYTDGLKIHTTIDSRLQGIAEASVRKHMAHLQELLARDWAGSDPWQGVDLSQLESFLPEGMDKLKHARRTMEVFSWKGKVEKEFSTMDSLKYYLGFLQTGFAAMDIHTGAILAWVGGIDHEHFKYDHVLARRQAGSAFKPLVYLEALEQGMDPCAYYPNDSVVYEDYENWTPRNADRTYGGLYSMGGALAHSVNTISVDLMMRAGMDRVIERSRLAGITSPLPEVPSLALGTAEISLLELLGAYQAIANRGLRMEPVLIRRIEDRFGRVLDEFPVSDAGSAICEPASAELLTAMLEGVVRKGTAKALSTHYGLEAAMAGKTGTTQKNTDGWFIGFTPDLVAGAWVGGSLQHIRFRSGRYGQGAYAALPIWGEFMQTAFRDPRWSRLERDSFVLSDGIREQLECDAFLEEKPAEFKPFKKLRKKGRIRSLFKRKERRRKAR
jgi:penicillin-binding protein 1A